MKNLQTLANELAANNMRLLVTSDMLHIKGGHGSTKKKSKKSKKSSKGGYGGGCGCGCGGW